MYKHSDYFAVARMVRIFVLIVSLIALTIMLNIAIAGDSSDQDKASHNSSQTASAKNVPQDIDKD